MLMSLATEVQERIDTAAEVAAAIELREAEEFEAAKAAYIAAEEEATNAATTTSTTTT